MIERDSQTDTDRQTDWQRIEGYMIVVNIYCNSHDHATDNDRTCLLYITWTIIISTNDDDDQIFKDRVYIQKVEVILSVESVCQLS